MKRKSNTKVDYQSGKYLSLTTLENDRQQQRQETLEWISIHALSKLRLAWRR